MTTSSVTGPDPYGEILAQANKLSDGAAEGSLATSDGKTPTEAVTDRVAGKIFGAANSLTRAAVIGPAEVVAGPVLETLDDQLPEEVPAIPVENLELREETTPLGEAIVNGFCEESYTGVDFGIVRLTKANAELGQKTLQALRDTLRVCARPAEALDRGRSTEASVEMILGAIESVSPDTRKALNLDTLAADLQNKVNGNPKNLLSVLLKGLVNTVPEAQTDRGGANPSAVLDMAPDANVPLGNGVLGRDDQKELLSGLSSGTHVDSYFKIPEKGSAELGGEDRSSSQDVLLGGPIKIPDLVVPPSDKTQKKAPADLGGEDKSSSQDVLLGGPIKIPDLVIPPSDTRKKPTKEKSPNSSESSNGTSQQEQHHSENSADSKKSEHKQGAKKFNFVPAPLDANKNQAPTQPGNAEHFSDSTEEPTGQDPSKPFTFEDTYVPPPPDFKRFTGEFKVSPAYDPLADEKRLADLCAYYKKRAGLKRNSITNLRNAATRFSIVKKS